MNHTLWPLSRFQLHLPVCQRALPSFHLRHHQLHLPQCSTTAYRRSRRLRMSVMAVQIPLPTTTRTTSCSALSGLIGTRRAKGYSRSMNMNHATAAMAVMFPELTTPMPTGNAPTHCMKLWMKGATPRVGVTRKRGQQRAQTELSVLAMTVRSVRTGASD